MEYEQLKLSNQLCFPIYTASRLVTKEYQPHLDALGITYPQYLVLMVLWETGSMTVNNIAKKLVLNTNTITPLLKRMEMQGLLKRQRSEVDERKVIVELTQKGEELKAAASTIPEKLASNLAADAININDLIYLKSKLDQLISILSAKNHQNQSL